MKDLVLGRTATEEEVKAMEEAQLILDAVGLELNSTKPKPRPTA